MSLFLFCTAAGPAVTIRKVDESTVNGTLADLKDGQIILTSPDAKIPLEDLVELENKGATSGGGTPIAAANTATRKLTGKVIGLEGSWNDEGNDRDKAFDGDLDSFFDAPEGHMDDAWVGLDLGSPKVITQIKYAPRPGQPLFQRRMVGGRFQGSNSADFSSAVTLATISDVPAVGKLASLNVSVTQAFRFVRYLTPGQGNGNVAEIEFWGRDAAPTGAGGGGARAPTTRRAATRAATTRATAASAPPPGTPVVTVRTAAVPAAQPAARASVLVIQGDTGEVVVPLPAAGGTVSVAQAGILKAAGPAAPTAAPPPPAPATKPATTQAAATATAPASYRITLAGDDQLTAPIVEWSEKSLRVSSPLGPAGRLDIPVESLREVWKGTADQVKQAKAISLAAGPEDAAFVVKDNAIVAVRGIVLGIAGNELRFKFNDEERKINLAKLVGVILGGTEANKHDTALRQTVVLSSGDAISGSWKSFDASTGAIGLQTPWGASLSIPVQSVSRIRSVNGRLTYLSDLKPAAVEQVPYFDRMLPYQVNRSLTGAKLKLSDGEYPRGIAVHSRTVLSYDLAGQYEEFKAKVGFQQPEGKLGRCIIRVRGDDKTLYEDLDARGDALKPADLSLKIAGVQRLTLEVDFGQNEDTGDRIVWANARVLRSAKH